MALAPIIAAALNVGLPARTRYLTVSGVDLVKQPRTTGNGYGTPIEGVRLTQAGPGGVSSLTWTTEDPEGVLGMDVGDPVRFWDITNDRPLFVGFVQNVRRTVLEPSGRLFDVTAIGIEAILDWAIVPSMTFPPGTAVYQAVQSLAGNTLTGTGELRDGASGGAGTQALPVDSISNEFIPIGASLVISEATTLREAIRQVTEAGAGTLTANTLPVATVDFYNGLRLYLGIVNGVPSGPFAEVGIIGPPPAGGGAATDVRVIDDLAISAVYVIGAGALRATASIGTSGRTAVISDATLTIQDQVQGVAYGYVQGQKATQRGTLTLDTIAPNTVGYVQGGSILRLTDSRLGQSDTKWNIGEIVRTFQGANETWDLTFGGLAPSLATLVRRLTRSTLS